MCLSVEIFCLSRCMVACTVQTSPCSFRLRAEEEQRRQQEARERQERAAQQAEEERARREEERRNREDEERRQKEQRWKDMQDQLDREVGLNKYSSNNTPRGERE